MHIRLWKLEKKHALYSSSSPVVVQLQGQPVNADYSCSSSLLYFYIFSCFIFTVTLFVCIITPNCYSTNITFLSTEVLFREIVPYFWILNFQAFHVSNIKSHSKCITAGDSGHSWSAYFSSLSLVSSNFCRFLERITSHFYLFDKRCIYLFRTLVVLNETIVYFP